MLKIIPITKNLYDEYIKSNLFYEMNEYSKEFSRKKNSIIYNIFWIKNSFLHFSRKVEYQFVFSEIDNNKKILDAGCGITFFPFFLNDKFSDINLDLLDYSKSAEKFYKDSKFKFINNDLNSIDIKDESYDLIYSISTLEHIETYSHVIRELIRILKPGGKLIITFDVSFSQHDLINTKNADEFINSTLFQLNNENRNYSLNIDNLVTSHDFNKHELPWKYPKIFYRVYYSFFKKKKITLWPPKIGIVMMSVSKN
jgi:ubiquinone/menaquinone biosynthesis C-methylase UbiE